MSEVLQIARCRALDPYVEQLRQWCLFGIVTDAGEGRTPIDIERDLPVVVTFERDQLARYFDPAEIADSPSATVVTELVALLLKIVTDIERIGEAVDLDVEQFYALQAELILDSTVGSALIDKLTAQIADPESEFRPDEAIYLVEVIGRLRRAVADVDSMIAETGRVRTALLSSPLAAGPAGKTGGTEARAADAREGSAVLAGSAEPSDADDAFAGKGASEVVAGDASIDSTSGDLSRLRKRGAGLPRHPPPPTTLRRHRRLQSRTIVLVLLLVGAALMRMDSPDTWYLASGVPELSLEHGELIQKVENLPPALYVDVRPGGWYELQSAERERIVEEVAKSADRAGYEGMLWRLPDGRIVAQWWSRRGVELGSPARR